MAPDVSSTRKSRVLAALDGHNLPSRLPMPAVPTRGPAVTVPAVPGLLSVKDKTYEALKRRLDSIDSSVSHTPEASIQGGKRRRTLLGRENVPRLEAAPLSSSFMSFDNEDDEDEDDDEEDTVDMPFLAGSSSLMKLSSASNLAPLYGVNFNLNYDRETPLSRIDMGGNDQAIRMAEFVSRSIENSSHGLSVTKAMEKLGLQHRQDLLPGMEVRLLAHQAIGVAWMLEQEKNTPHKGGILADDMGLGKTVQMIATMVMNLPTDQDKYKTTLIVVPAALLLQWKEELETKSNGVFSIHIHHGRDKLQTAKDMDQYDVVITTYQTLSIDLTVPSDVEPGYEMEWLLNNGGPLARHKWYRVVADEAQFIRNRGTRASRAMAMLRAKYRWCLTGTPVTNTLADIYGLLRFGHFRPWNDWEDFNMYIAKVQLDDAPLAALRSQEILKPLLLRRTKDAELEGRPILELPPKHIELVKLDFSSDERQLYDSFEKRAQVQINRFIRNGTVDHNQHAVLVLILRLRQLCCHPHLILSLAEGFEDPTMLVASEADKEIARASKTFGANWVRDVKQRLMARARAEQFDFANEADEPGAMCPACGDLFMDGSGRLLACGHEVCSDCLDDMRVSSIAHNGEFGNADERTNMRIEKEFENAVAKGLRPCPKCKRMNDLRPAYVFLSAAFEPSRDEVRRAIQHSREMERTRASALMPRSKPHSARNLIQPQEIEDLLELSDSSDDELPDLSELLAEQKPLSLKGKGKVGRTPSLKSDAPDETMKEAIDSGNDEHETTSEKTKPSEHLIATWNESGDHVEESVKMIALVTLLKEWEVTGDKTIVFSQWTSMLDLVERVFARYGIRNLRYDGTMNREARDFVLAQFRKPEGPRVICISTKCGGVGLNLVTANRVINLDLSWNYASESQAYDRVHRLGQEKEVHVKRLVVRNTIEERMLVLQDTKTGLAEAALGEGSGVKLHKLSVRQLKDLFGMNKPQTESQPQPPQDN